MKVKRHLYLVSDATGETVRSIARACAVQFEDIEVVEHLWPMVRSRRALETALEDLEHAPGIVFYSLLNHDLAAHLEQFCRSRNVPCISVMEPFITLMARCFGQVPKGLPGKQHVLDAEYFHRIEAMNFVMAHDDGQKNTSLDEADVILVGVSRTSKTPTCIYLANRGVKAANVPIVPGIPLPEALFKNGHALVIGLTEDPARLVEIRKNRMRLQNSAQTQSDYTDIDKVREEVAESKRLFARQGWPVIDVTRRSIEETAAAVLQLLSQRHRQQGEGEGGSASGGNPP
ncbi:MAG TPA: pyruvate, water dikinase regulatory protein [Alphaproteobacteria bacterium]|jgi:regulator of PEP synthase PpsR (kinase-PPPase family)